MAVCRLPARRIHVIEQRKPLDEGMLIRQSRGENGKLWSTIAPCHISQHLVVGTVLFDDQKHVFDQRRLANVFGNRDRLGRRIDVLLAHFNIRRQVPVIVVEDLFAELSELLRVRLRDQIHHTHISMGVICNRSAFRSGVTPRSQTFVIGNHQLLAHLVVRDRCGEVGRRDITNHRVGLTALKVDDGYGIRLAQRHVGFPILGDSHAVGAGTENAAGDRNAETDRPHRLIRVEIDDG